LTPGEVFSPSKLAMDVEGISDLYGSRGYIDTRVIPQKNANIEKGTMDLGYTLQEGEKSYVEKIEIRGNTKTKDKVIRRELAISPGETFDMVKVKVSKSILEQMQYFEKVDTQPEESDAGPNRKNLIIAVEEKNTGNIAIGAGFSSIDSIVGFAEISQGNFDLFNPPHFTGGGQKARLRAQYGSERQDYIATFVEPWFLGRRLELSVELYHRDLNYLSDNYDETRTGGRIGLRRALPYNFIVGMSYTLESIDIEFEDSYKIQYPDSVLLEEEGRRLVSRVGTSLAHDTRNNFILPTRGHRVELLGEVAGGPLGGDTSFYRLEARAAQYFSPVQTFKMTSGMADFFQGHVLELIGRIGVVEAFGDGDRGDEDRVPLFDRFFLGGLYSLRGYEYRDVGPRDPTSDEPIGGDTYWFASAEYSIPIIERLRFAFFYDIGMVYPQAYSFSTKDKSGYDYQTGSYNDNWGVGLRLNLPIGPLRLDYGIPIHHGKHNGGSGEFQFGVGYSREF
jgi:outer membrane protein insertion porin family